MFVMNPGKNVITYQDSLNKEERQRVEDILNRSKEENYIGSIPPLSLPSFDKKDNYNSDSSNKKDLKCIKPPTKLTKRKPITVTKANNKNKVTFTSTKINDKKKLLRSSDLKLNKPVPLPRRLRVQKCKNAMISDLETNMNHEEAYFEQIIKENTLRLNELRLRSSKNAQHIQNVQQILKNLVTSLDHFSLEEVEVPNQPKKEIKGNQTLTQSKKPIKHEDDKKYTIDEYRGIMAELVKYSNDNVEEPVDSNTSHSSGLLDNSIGKLEELETEVSSILKKYSNKQKSKVTY